jgi:transposase-like protein
MEGIISFKGQNEIEFLKQFHNKESCFSYLAHHKWANGFECPNCKSTKEDNCKILYHKRCKQCFRIISPTAQTLFHNVKFGIEKAFYIVFKMSATTKSISAEQLAKTVGINRKSALLFQHKVRRAMQNSQEPPMSGQVEVDEAFIGQKEKGQIGRGSKDKAQVVVAIEKHGSSGIKRMYAKKIDNAGSSELEIIFDEHISKTAKILTDKWRGYSPISKRFNITQEKSEPDKNFKVMHRGIQQLKSWISGIHHSVDKRYLQAYLVEFCYRINRSIHKEGIFDNLMMRMIKTQNITKNQMILAYSR